MVWSRPAAPEIRPDTDAAPAARRRAWLAACAVGSAVAFLVLLVLVGTHWHPLDLLDRHVDRSLNSYIGTRPAQADLWQAVSAVLAPVVLRILLLAVALAAWWRGRRRAALAVAAVDAGSLVLSSGLKALVGRPRPTVAHRIATASGASFPSGHALTSMAAALALALLWPVAARLARLVRLTRIVATAVAAVAVLAVGFSRLVLGVHYLTDVLAGWLLAAALVSAVWLIAFPPATRPALACR